MGLQKQIELPPSPQVTESKITPPMSPGLSNFEWQGIPIDVIRHFNGELGTIPVKDIEMLKDITAWAKSKTTDEPSIGNILQQISKVQRELGSPAHNEKAYEKTWRFIKAQKVIDEMRKQQDSMRVSPWIG